MADPQIPDLGEMLGLPSEELQRPQPRGDLLDYYLGPTGIPDRLRAANEVLNPIVALSDAGQDLRRGDYVGALTNTAAAAVPIVGGRMAIKAARGLPTLAPRQYDEAASAVTETLTGVTSPKSTSATDMTRRQFLTGVAAAGGTAAMGPDIVELARKAAPDIARQAGPWEALVARARNALNNPVPMSRTVVEGPNGPVSYEPEEIMDLHRVRQDELNMLFDDVYEEALSDPAGFADTILRKTDPEDTLEKIGINRRIESAFARSGLDYKGLSEGALKEYPEEVAKRANVSVEDVSRYLEEMDEDYQDYLAMKGYDRLVDYNPELVRKLDSAAIGVARDKLLDGDIDEVNKLIGNAPTQFIGVSSDDFQLWKALEQKRRQLADDQIEMALDVGAIDDEIAENLRKKLSELSASEIFYETGAF